MRTEIKRGIIDILLGSDRTSVAELAERLGAGRSSTARAVEELLRYGALQKKGAALEITTDIIAVMTKAYSCGGEIVVTRSNGELISRDTVRYVEALPYEENVARLFSASYLCLEAYSDKCLRTVCCLTRDALPYNVHAVPGFFDLIGNREDLLSSGIEKAFGGSALYISRDTNSVLLCAEGRRLGGFKKMPSHIAESLKGSLSMISVGRVIADGVFEENEADEIRRVCSEAHTALTVTGGLSLRPDERELLARYLSGEVTK